MKRAGHKLFASLLALGAAMPAFAQQTPQEEKPTPTSQAREDTKDVVIVTANKREESVQDIAVAVTAISSELRDQIGLNTVKDFTNFAPGLTYSASNDRLGIRGVSRNTNNFGIPSGISNYVDGIYYSSAIPAGKPPIFGERVEVVRGPQGTLYGRDSIGGALNLISKRPSSTFTAQMDMRVDNFNTRAIEARVSGPITDWLRYSIGGERTDNSKGYFHNASGLEDEGGRNDEYYLEGQLAANLGDKIDVWLKVNRLEWTRKGLPGARTGVDAPSPYDMRPISQQDSGAVTPNPWYGLSDPNRVQVGNQNTNPSITDRFAFNTDFTNFAHLRPTTEDTLEVVYHAPQFDIKYLGGYVYYNYDLQQDNDGSPIKQYSLNGRPIYTESISDYQENRGWFSNEINLVSTGDGKLQWAAGVYAYQENYSQTVFTNTVHDPGGPVYGLNALQAWLGAGGPLAGLPAPTPLPVLPTANGRNYASGATVSGASLGLFSDNLAVNSAYGVYAQGDYSFDDHWKITAGLRWSEDVVNTREYARLINHYVTESALESGYTAGLAAALHVPPAAIAPAIAAAVPPKVDITTALIGVDGATGRPGRGIKNVVAPPGGVYTSTTCQVNPNYCGVYLDSATGNYYRDMGDIWSRITGVLDLDWTPDNDTLVYLKYSRGYKPGGFGAAEVYGLLSPAPRTDNETVDAFELGLKREWPAWRLTTNVDLYYNDYKGYQISNTVVPPAVNGVAPPPYSAYVNIDKTEMTGVELETIWRPLDHLRFLFNYAYTNPEIKDAPALVHSLDPYALDPAAVKKGAAAANGQQGQDLSGNILPGITKNKIALNGVYTFDFGDGSRLDTSLSYFWQDIAYSSIFNRSYTKIPSWDQWDARLSWTSSDGHFTVIGFGKNIFDEIGYDSRSAGRRVGIGTTTVGSYGSGNYVAPTLCGTTTATTAVGFNGPTATCYTQGETLTPPRIYGVEFQFHF